MIVETIAAENPGGRRPKGPLHPLLRVVDIGDPDRQGVTVAATRDGVVLGHELIGVSRGDQVRVYHDPATGFDPYLTVELGSQL